MSKSLLVHQLDVRYIANAGYSIRRNQFQEYIHVVHTRLGEIKSVSIRKQEKNYGFIPHQQEISRRGV